MTFKFEEKPASRSYTKDPPTEVRRYVAAGEFDSDNVMAYALSNTAAIIGSAVGNLFRQDVKLDEVGYKIYDVVVPYAGVKRDAGSYTFRWDGTGETAHITQSLSTVNSYGTSPPDHKGAIGYHNGEIDGVDIVVPSSKFIISFRHPTAWFSFAYAASVSSIVGYVNSALMFGFAAGEILFTGFTGSEGTDTETSVDYSFVRQPNATGLTVGAISSIVKQGHDYLWVRYKDAVDTNRSVRQPEFVYVERVYPRTNLAGVLGFG